MVKDRGTSYFFPVRHPSREPKSNLPSQQFPRLRSVLPNTVRTRKFIAPLQRCDLLARWRRDKNEPRKKAFLQRLGDSKLPEDDHWQSRHRIFFFRDLRFPHPVDKPEEVLLTDAPSGAARVVFAASLHVATSVHPRVTLPRATLPVFGNVVTSQAPLLHFAPARRRRLTGVTVRVMLFDSGAWKP